MKRVSPAATGATFQLTAPSTDEASVFGEMSSNDPLGPSQSAAPSPSSAGMESFVHGASVAANLAVDGASAESVSRDGVGTGAPHPSDEHAIADVSVRRAITSAHLPDRLSIAW